MGFSPVKDVDLIQCNLKSVAIFSNFNFLGKNIDSSMFCYSLAKHARFYESGIVTFSRRHLISLLEN